MPPRKRTEDTPAREPEHHPNLAAALIAFQGEMPVVAKNKTANVPMKAGGSYSYKYADLGDVTAAAIPLLVRHGLAFSACPRAAERGYELVGTLLHTTGERLEGALPLHGNQPQEIGSALTYARRYLLGCMTGIVTDDDDDAQATHSSQATRQWDGPTTATLLRQIEKDAAKAGVTYEQATAKFCTQRGLTVEQLDSLNPWEVKPLADAVAKRAEEVAAEHAAAQQPATDAAPYVGPTTEELLGMIQAHADRAHTTLEEITAKWRADNGALHMDDLAKVHPRALVPLEASIAAYLLANPPGE